jgi:hypothetical protein
VIGRLLRHLLHRDVRADDVPMPQNVRVRRADGSTLPLELAYQGRNRQGYHEWVAVLTFRALPGDQLVADVLPPCTSITVSYTAEA